MGNLTKQAYEKIIKEDILEIEKYFPEHSLEKQHIIDVLNSSVNQLYLKPEISFSETYALGVLKRHINHSDRVKMIKKLSEEVSELAMGIATENEENIEEELGDCLLILLHIKSTLKTETSILNIISETAQKVSYRFTTGYYDKKD